MKRFAILFFALVILISMAACNRANNAAGASGQASTAASHGVINFNEEPYTLVVCYPVLSEANPDLQLIEEAINRITLREINARVQFEAVGLFSMANIYALRASSREKTDLMMIMPGYNYLAPFASNRMIQPIGLQIEEWGPAIKQILGNLLQAGTYRGEQYAVPQNSELLTNAYGFNLSVPLSEKHGIAIENIKSIEDLEAAFEIIRRNEPGVVVVTPEQSGSSILLVLQGKTDNLGTRVAALQTDAYGKLTAVHGAGQSSYMDAARKVREWYQRGFISRDVATTPESGSQMLWGGRAFATAAPSLGPEMGGFQMGTQWRAVMLKNEIFVTTSDSQTFMWTVPTSNARVDKAVQFLNLAFESYEIANLFRYGIEDNHHRILPDGSAQLVNTAGWQYNWNVLGDIFKIRRRDDSVAAAGVPIDEIGKMADAWNARAVFSPAYGFIFDPTAVRTEIAACDTVRDEFERMIGNGTVDPETEIPRFLRRLNEAGAQRVIEEVQRQLDEWAAVQR